MKTRTIALISLVALGGCQTLDSIRLNEPKKTFMMQGNYVESAECVNDKLNMRARFDLRIFKTEETAEITPDMDVNYYIISFKPGEQPDTTSVALYESKSYLQGGKGFIDEAVDACTNRSS